MSSVPVSPRPPAPHPVEFGVLTCWEVGRRDGLATLDSLHASGLHLHGHMGTLCRDAPEGMRGTGL